MQNNGLYLLHVSVHGLIRGQNLELGRDSDTGGQTKYVVELTRELSKHPEVAQVDLLTRQVVGKGVDDDYAQVTEPLSDSARIVRLPCGPKRYIKKEKLWPYLDSFVDAAIHHIRKQGRVPDAVHGHYADAGYVAAQLARLFGVPCIFTGHSLGRVKRKILLDKGNSKENVQKKFRFSERIEAEETALDTASIVVASTSQEIEQQYALYDNYQTRRMIVIPPGVDLARFSAPEGTEWESEIGNELKRFLQFPERPMILAIARPDERKNLPTLVKAFGEHPKLREIANLVIVAGNRDDLADLQHSSRKVLRNLMTMIDQYDLYGTIAYPKQHASEDVPILYRLAALSKGLFVNPAFTEPFGLTLIEAAASGLPIIATDDGGPRDIISTCKNGELIDPQDSTKLGAVLFEGIENTSLWKERAESGLSEVEENYSWTAHANRYVQKVNSVVEMFRADRLAKRGRAQAKLPSIDRLLLTNVDETLTKEPEAVRSLFESVATSDHAVGLGFTTGRSLESLLETLEAHSIPRPDLLLVGAGSEIYYGAELIADRAWASHIRFRWNRSEIVSALEGIPGLYFQDQLEQTSFKISLGVEDPKLATKRKIAKQLRSNGIRANIIFSGDNCIDVLPIRASTGLAIRHLLWKWALSPEQVLAVGTSGNEEAMLSGNTLGVVVGKPSKEIAKLKGRPRIYFSSKEHAWGILEGIEYYDFLGKIRIPNEAEADTTREEGATNSEGEGAQVNA